MAVGTHSDFVIYDDEFYGGLNETIRQNTSAFNEASNNALRLLDEASVGDFQKEAFFQKISSLVSRRDTSSTSSATSQKLGTDDRSKPKLHRKIGPVEDTLSALKQVPTDQSEFSFLVGQQAGLAKMQDFLDSLLLIGNTVLQQTTSGGPTGNGAYFDATGQSTSTMTADHLLTGLARYGDARTDLRAIVMHSKPFYDLASDLQSNFTIDSVAGQQIAQGPDDVVFGLPIVITDSADLKNAGAVSSSTDIYQTLILAENALIASESQEDDAMVTDVITGNENITWRIQGEHAYVAEAKGYDFTGSANPTDSALGSTGNWTSVASATVKDGPGVLIETT